MNVGEYFRDGKLGLMHEINYCLQLDTGEFRPGSVTGKISNMHPYLLRLPVSLRSTTMNSTVSDYCSV